jgi:HAE1 family hydrophobic/amphiphilic exporter-1
MWTRLPTGFVPDEDPGIVIVAIQGPTGASIDYTLGIAKQAEAILSAQPEVNGIFTVTGFSFLGSGSNRGTMFVRLKPFDERPGEAHSAMAVIQRVFFPFTQISGAIVLPFLPPPIQGIGRFGGLQFEVLDATGGNIEDLEKATNALVGQGNQTPGLARPLLELRPTTRS